MQIRHYRDTRLFLERTGPFLLEAEPEHSMILSLGARVLDERCYLVTVEDGNAVAACALWTPPFGLLITRAPDAILDGLVDDVSLAYETLPSVLAPEPTASAFARRWEQRKGTRTRTLMQTRPFAARTVQGPASPPPGVMRPAIEAEWFVMSAWVAAFDEKARIGNPLMPAARPATTRQQVAVCVGRRLCCVDREVRVPSRAGWPSKQYSLTSSNHTFTVNYAPAYSDASVQVTRLSR